MRWISTDESPPFFFLSLALPKLLKHHGKMAKTFIEFEGQRLVLQKSFYGMDPFVPACELCCMRDTKNCIELGCEDWDTDDYSIYYVLDDDLDMPISKSAKTPQAKRGGGRKDK